jgi:AraC-like DNA-binding protein
MLPGTPNIHLDDSAGRVGPIFARRIGQPSGTVPLASAVSHDYAAVSLFVAGGARVDQRSRWTLEPGDALIVPAGEPHRMIDRWRLEAWGVGFCVPCLAADRFAALLEEVAERVGYADVTHFIRLFRRTHGVTPAAWRAAQRRPPLR